MIYEYRRYQAVPGKLPDLHERFQAVTLPLWGELGIKPMGFWEAAIGLSNEIHYMLSWEDMAERDDRWERFQRDSRWHDARRRTEANGPLIVQASNQLWRATSYSPEVLGA